MQLAPVQTLKKKTKKYRFFRLSGGQRSGLINW